MRLIQPQEINCYCKQVFTNRNGNGATALLLLYKDARYDMAVLDEVYGAMNWMVDYKVINDCLYCTISVYNKETGEWISKSSNGTESNMEAQKGEASDALKRAGFLWGIGRELYTAPQIKFSLNPDEYQNNKLNSWIKFHVSDIAYDEARNISYITVADEKGNQRFSWGYKPSQVSQQTQQTVQQNIQQNVEQKPMENVLSTPDRENCKAAWMNLLHHFGYDDADRRSEASSNAVSSAKAWTKENFGEEIQPLKFTPEHIEKIRQFLEGPESFQSDPLP